MSYKASIISVPMDLIAISDDVGHEKGQGFAAPGQLKK